jgi:hypothetical protein
MFVQGLGQQDRRAGVGLEVRGQGFVAETLDVVVLEHRCVVDHRIECAEVRDNARHQCPRLRFIGKVGLKGLDPAPRCCELPAIIHRTRRLRAGPAVVHGHLPARGRQGERDGAPQPLGGAGHQDRARAL